MSDQRQIEVDVELIRDARPGDLLILRAKQELSIEEALEVTRRAQSTLPDGVQVLVIDAGAEAEYLRAADRVRAAFQAARDTQESTEAEA